MVNYPLLSLPAGLLSQRAQHAQTAAVPSSSVGLAPAPGGSFPSL